MLLFSKLCFVPACLSLILTLIVVDDIYYLCSGSSSIGFNKTESISTGSVFLQENHNKYKAIHPSSVSVLTKKSRRPNFVVVLTDDLDWTLGGANASTLAKTRRWLGGGDAGRSFENWFVQTPVCCASRAEILTGKLYHNLKVKAFNQSGCMHIDVADDPKHSFWQNDYFSNFFAGGTAFPKLNLRYSVGIFGKHLNTHNPTHFLPNGVDEMLINGGGNYLNPTFTHGKRILKRSTGQNIGGPTDDFDTIIEKVTFDDCIESTGMPCYSTSVIGNASLAWIEKQITNSSGDIDDDYNPFLTLISVKAPHIQDGNGFPLAIPAPWYENFSIPESMAPRTPTYNLSAKDHHWLVQSQPPLSTLEAAKVDKLYVSRLKTLKSVDDLVEALVWKLSTLGVLDDTYVLFTSDNGYRFGQFRMPQCKLHPYENDIRVPMMIRGPGITAEHGYPTGDSEEQSPKYKKQRDGMIFSHVHLMPTLLGLATGLHDSQDIIPDGMDGSNLASYIVDRSYKPEKRNSRGHATAKTDHHSVRNMTSRIYSRRTAGLRDASKAQGPMTPTALLIEYTSLGNVVRYRHLIDTYNHSFVALRIAPNKYAATTYSASRSINSKEIKRDSMEEMKAKQSPVPSKNPEISIMLSSNLKYIEFRDSRVDWTNTESIPLERELYNLDEDPYEMKNLIEKVDPVLLKALEAKTQRMIKCSGASCRKEHSTGLEYDIDRSNDTI